MEFAKRSLCESNNDYDLLLENLNLIETIIKCDGDGNVIKTDTAIQILKKIFCGDITSYNNLLMGVWTTTTKILVKCDNLRFLCTELIESCFKDLHLYYYNKCCKIKSKIWQPKLSDKDKKNCIAYALIFLCVDIKDPCTTTFKAIADKFAEYLSAVGCNIVFCKNKCIDKISIDTTFGTYQTINVYTHEWSTIERGYKLANVLLILKAFCELLKQRIEIERVLNKVILTTNKCEL